MDVDREGGWNWGTLWFRPKEFKDESPGSYAMGGYRTGGNRSHLDHLYVEGTEEDLRNIAGIHHDGHVLEAAQWLMNHYSPKADMTSFNNHFINHHPEVHKQLLAQGGDLLREMGERTLRHRQPYGHNFREAVNQAADHFDVLRDHLNEHGGDPAKAMQKPYHNDLIEPTRRALANAVKWHEAIRGAVTPDPDDDGPGHGEGE